MLAGWRRLWAVLRENPVEYGAYLVVSVVLGGVGAALVGSVVGLVAGIALLPVGAALLGLGALGLPPLLLIVLVPFLLVALAVLLALSAVASVPVVAYLRYYALSVLGRTSRYDLRPPRPAVRRIGGDRPSDVSRYCRTRLRERQRHPRVARSSGGSRPTARPGTARGDGGRPTGSDGPATTRRTAGTGVIRSYVVRYRCGVTYIVFGRASQLSDPIELENTPSDRGFDRVDR